MQGGQWGFYLTLEASKTIHHLHHSLLADFRSEGQMQDLVMAAVDGHNHSGRQTLGWMILVPRL